MKPVRMSSIDKICSVCFARADKEEFSSCEFDDSVLESSERRKQETTSGEDEGLEGKGSWTWRDTEQLWLKLDGSSL